MPHPFFLGGITSSSYKRLHRPIKPILTKAPLLKSRCNRPLQMEFEHQLDALIFFHLEEHTSGRHLMQTLQEDDFARDNIAPPAGIKKSAFFEAMTERGLEQFIFVFRSCRSRPVKPCRNNSLNSGNWSLSMAPSLTPSFQCIGLIIVTELKKQNHISASI